MSEALTQDQYKEIYVESNTIAFPIEAVGHSQDNGMVTGIRYKIIPPFISELFDPEYK